MVRGTEHPHSEDVGKMVSVLEDVRSSGRDRTDPCERVRRTNRIKIKQMQVLAAGRLPVWTGAQSQGPALSQGKTGRSWM